MKRKRTWTLLGAAVILAVSSFAGWWFFSEQTPNASAAEANENCH
jgi:hypothetical protein